MATRIAEVPDPRELDMLLTAGERIAMSLLGIAINARGCRAASYTGSQAGIITDTQHGKAKIVEIRPKRVVEALEAGNVVVLAGFQGLSNQYEITTLGPRRVGPDGGGDGRCGRRRHLRDLHGRGRRLHRRSLASCPTPGASRSSSYEEMLELAAAGAKVLQSRSVEMARRHDVRIHVRSSFGDDPGTWVQEVDEDMLEGVLISGAALDTDETKVTIDAVPDKPGVAASIFKAIAADGINVDMIVQNVGHDGTTDLSFTAPREDVPRLRDVLGPLVRDIGAERFTLDEGIAKLSLVGAGMKSHPGVAADMFDVLAGEGVNIEMISTSPIRISCVIREADAERALRAVHARFELDRTP